MARPQSEDIDRIDELGRAVLAGQVGHDLFAPLARRIGEALDVAACAIYTFQPIDRTVRVVAAWSHEDENDVRTGQIESLARRWDFAAVIAQDTAVELHADSDVLNENERRRMRRTGEQATLTGPLALYGDVVGLVSVTEKRAPRRFTTAERALFDAYCDAAAIAIHADALNRQLEERNRQLVLRLQERDRLTRELRTLSLRDDMTGLLNRRGFFTLAAQQFKLARRIGHRSVAAFIDIDGMKSLNDVWGHVAGDQALRTTAGLLRATFREADIIGRIGGDEFAVLMTEATDVPAQAAVARLTRILADWRAANSEGWAATFDLSIGVAECRGASACDLDDLIARADAAMYAYKRARRTTRRRAG